ncbi:MAG: CidA/LrgA family protein [Halofilum sp. (in: g-proteobacteria)]|nr:CidA/LrgA family protein [Halofilum sp. (in: g-proteobacteria)]
MIGAIAALLAFQLAGEIGVRLLGVPVPGPVAGMLLLFAALALRRRVPDDLATTANGVLAHLSLLFVPAGVGIIAHGERLAGIWPALLLTLVASTVLAVAVTALTLAGLRRVLRGGPAS